MIEEGVFRSEWAALCERFRLTGDREPSQLMLRRYYEFLTERLTTQQFEAAARQLYATQTFFPRPQDFVEAALGSPRERASQEWPAFRRAIGGDREAREALSDEAHHAAALLGGWQALGRTSLSEMEWLRKRFLEVHESAQSMTEREAIEGIRKRPGALEAGHVS